MIEAAEAVADPCAGTRTAGKLETGLEESNRGVVVDRLGLHRLDQAQLIGDLCGVRDQLAEPHSGLAMLPKFEQAGRGGECCLVGGHAGKALAHTDGFGQVGATGFR